jgi:hypothetical protein
MNNAQAEIDVTMDELLKARKWISRGKSNQVGAAPELDLLKSVAYTWFNRHRENIGRSCNESELLEIDTALRSVLDSTARRAARSTYIEALKVAREALVTLRSGIMGRSAAPSTDAPPDFSPLATDDRMRQILVRRWDECQRCFRAEAHLAATVMMGGLLEALFVARANQLADKSPLFKCRSTPIDSKTKKPLALPEWTLRPYIDVAHELKWISQSGRDVGSVLRDYRNYIHPQKEYSHDVNLGQHDSQMFWEITKSLCRQLLSLPTPSGGAPRRT